MKSSTRDKVEGSVDEAKGKIKQKVGRAAGDSETENRGAAERAGGAIQRKVGDVKKVFGK